MVIMTEAWRARRKRLENASSNATSFDASRRGLSTCTKKKANPEWHFFGTNPLWLVLKINGGSHTVVAAYPERQNETPVASLSAFC